jgi:hypothetical protein
MEGKKIDGWSGERSRLFCYGQDMHPDFIGKRGEKAEPIAVARLEGFRLDFSGRSAYWGGGEENALPAEGSVLWGTVYSLSFKDAETLDAERGAKLDGTGPYYHYPVVVIDASGGEHHALMYRKSAIGAPKPPSRAQLECIVEGARARGLPGSYIASLVERPVDPEAGSPRDPDLLGAPAFKACDCGGPPSP